MRQRFWKWLARYANRRAYGGKATVYLDGTTLRASTLSVNSVGPVTANLGTITAGDITGIKFLNQ